MTLKKETKHCCFYSANWSCQLLLTSYFKSFFLWKQCLWNHAIVRAHSKFVNLFFSFSSNVIRVWESWTTTQKLFFKFGETGKKPSKTLRVGKSCTMSWQWGVRYNANEDLCRKILTEIYILLNLNWKVIN